MEIKENKETINCNSEMVILKSVNPSDFDHLALFLGSCHAWREKHQRHFTIRACLKNLYKIFDWNRHPLLRTTSRRSAPLGDPRGIPKLSRKFSQSKSYLRFGDRAITSVHTFKFEGSVNIFIASLAAEKIFFEVNIDIGKMSDLIESDLFFFDGLLEQLGNSMEFVSDEGSMPVLNDLELGITGEFDMNLLNDVSNPSSSLLTSDINHPEVSPVLSIPSAPVTPNGDHEIIITIPNEIELLWNQEEFLSGSVVTPESVALSPTLTEAPQDQLLTKAQIEKAKNNQASREYRQRRKSKLVALQEELEELEAKNRHLRMKEIAMQEIVDTLKSKLISLLANERTGCNKRPNDDQHIVTSGKKIKL